MPLKNFGAVYRQAACIGSSILYRCAQPDADGFKSLRMMGVNTVFKLNNNDEFSDNTERDMFLNIGGPDGIIPRVVELIVRCNPLPEIFRGEYTDNIVFTVIDIMMAMKRGNVAVHCVHGTDRTGLVCAAFMLINGAPMDAVMQYRAEFGVSELRDIVDYQDHPVIQEIDRRVKAGMLPPKGVDRV